MKTSRVIRFTKLDDGLLAHYEAKRNMLLVNKVLYDALPTEHHKALVLRSENPYMLVEDIQTQ